MPHVWLVSSLCCCLVFSGLRLVCPPVLHVLLLLDIDKKIKKRELTYKLGMFLWLVYRLISKNVNNIWDLPFSWFMFSSTAHGVRMVSVHKEVSAWQHRLYADSTRAAAGQWDGWSHVSVLPLMDSLCSDSLLTFCQTQSPVSYIDRSKKYSCLFPQSSWGAFVDAVLVFLHDERAVVLW